MGGAAAQRRLKRMRKHFGGVFIEEITFKPMIKNSKNFILHDIGPLMVFYEIWIFQFESIKGFLWKKIQILYKQIEIFVCF